MCLFRSASKSILAASAQPNNMDFPSSLWSVVPGICVTTFPKKLKIKLNALSSGKNAPKRNSGI